MRIYAISGSLRTSSVHSALLRAMRDNAPDSVEIVLCDCLGELPAFNPDNEGAMTPHAVLAFAGEVGRADALLVASPEYAHGIPGGLKNAFDWLVSRPELVGKPVMFAHGYTLGRGAFVLSALEEVLRTASLHIMPGDAFSVALVGRTGEEVSEILEAPDIRRSMYEAILRLEDWVDELA